MSTAEEQQPGNGKYWAFISYSHKDKKWGDWLHRKLETFRVPYQVRVTDADEQPIPKRMFPVFRDREELPTSADLGRTIESALSQSRTLIVICSPNSAQSRWVNEEILAFKRMGRGDRIFCLIVDGEPNASDDPATASQECFPEALRYKLGDDGNLTDIRTEPIAADARDRMDGRQDSFLKLAAGVLGVGFDDLKRRDHQRQIRSLSYIGAAAGVIAITMAGLAFLAFQARGEAVAQGKIADANFRQAKQAVDRFFTQVSQEELFEVHGLQPLQQKLLEDSLEYYEEFRDQQSDDPTLKADVAGAMQRIGEVRSLIGDRPLALESMQQAETALDGLLQSDPDNFSLRFQRADLHEAKALTLWEMEKSDEALPELSKAVDLLDTLKSERPENIEVLVAWQNILKNLGPIERQSGRIEDARKTYHQALDGESLRVNEDDPRHAIFVASAALNLGILVLEVDRDVEAALQRFEQCDVVATEALELAADQKTKTFAIEKRTLKDLLVSARIYQAKTLAALGRIDDAASQAQSGLEIARSLFEQNPSVIGYQESVAILASNLAALRDALGNEDTTGLHREAVEMSRRLAINHSANQAFQLRFAQSLNNLAIRQVNSGDNETATQTYGEAISTMGELIRQSGDEANPQLSLQMINSRRNLGSAWMTLGNFDRADDGYAQADRELGDLLDRTEAVWRPQLLSVQDGILERRIQIAKETENESVAKACQSSLSRCLQARLELDDTAVEPTGPQREARHRLQYRFAKSLLDEDKNKLAAPTLISLVDSIGQLAEDERSQMETTLVAYAHANLGWLTILERRFNESVLHSRQALNMQPEDWMRVNLVAALLLDGQPEPAKAAAKQLTSAGDAETVEKMLADEFEQLSKRDIEVPLAEEFLRSLAETPSPQSETAEP